ncbi:MAG TPA: hypothetical protein VMY37_40910 [Thermoguttaceae bacterium]|nr:hypothetical protein [Thermoguttaceae bacterium]
MVVQKNGNNVGFKIAGSVVGGLVLTALISAGVTWGDVRVNKSVLGEHERRIQRVERLTEEVVKVQVQQQANTEKLDAILRRLREKNPS